MPLALAPYNELSCSPVDIVNLHGDYFLSS